MEQVAVINIAWEKIPYGSGEIKEKVSDSDYGLYQIYGHHPSYGDESLLYIGKAQEQTFGVRLNERWEFVESCSRPTSIRLGRIMKSSKKGDSLGWDIKRWGEMIGIAEVILIKTHAPAFNKQINSGVFSAELSEFNKEQFLIINWDDYGQLLPEISNLRMSFRYWNHDTALNTNDIELLSENLEIITS